MSRSAPALWSSLSASAEPAAQTDPATTATQSEARTTSEAREARCMAERRAKPKACGFAIFCAHLSELDEGASGCRQATASRCAHASGHQTVRGTDRIAMLQNPIALPKLQVLADRS